MLEVKPLRSFAPKLIAFLILFLALLYVPDRVATDTHDQGSQAALESWTLHHVRYGRDIHQNVGPLVFISYPLVLTGFLDIEKSLVEIALVAALAFLLLSSWPSIGWNWFLPLVIFLLFPAPTQDSILYFLAFVCVRDVLCSQARFPSLIAALVLSLIACGKGTFSAIWILVLGVNLLLNMRERNLLRLERSLLLLLAFPMFWFLSGQHFEDIPSYFTGVIYFSSGYNEAMALVEPKLTAVLGILAALSLAGVLIVRFMNEARANLWVALATLAAEAFVAFAAWKHGFVRADGHMYIFFGFITLVLTLSLMPAEFYRLLRKPRAWPALFVACLLVNGLGIYYTHALLEPDARLPSALHNAAANVRFLFNARSTLSELHMRLEQSIQGMLDPQLKTLVGSEPISYLGELPAPMVYGDYNFKVSPSTISFASWNERIAEHDKAFYENPDLPFVVFSNETIDGRYSPADSSLSKLELLTNFKVAGGGKDRLYLKRVANRHKRMDILEISPSVDTDHEIQVPVYDGLLWLSVAIEPMWTEKIVALFYKPNLYYLLAKFSDGSVGMFRLIPRMAKIGFLANPVLTSISEWSEFLSTGKTNRRLVSLAVHCQRVLSQCPREIRFTFSKIDLEASK
jgi:hypothetical protein